MGLRDFLANLEIGSKGFGSAAESAEKMRQQAAQQEFAQMAPELLRQGQFEEMAGQAIGMGDMSIARDLIGETVKSRVKKDTMVPWTKSELMAQGIPSDKAEVFGQMDYAKQKEAVNNFEAARSAGMTQQGLNLQAEGQRRLAREEVQKQRKSTGDRFAKLEKDLSEEARIFDKLDFVLKNPSQPGDRIVVNFLARNMAGEKGPLSDSDIAGFTGTSVWESAEKAEQWLTASAQSPVGSERRKQYNALIKAARDNFDKYKKESIVKTFNQAIEDNPRLVDGDTVDDMLKSKAKRLSEKTGQEISFSKDQDGNLVATLGKKSAPINAFNKDGLVDLDAMEKQAELIQDTAAREKALKNIRANKGKTISVEKVKQFYEKNVAPYLPKQ
jgi:uncharacterized protein YneF (UPF0154 family)